MPYILGMNSDSYNISWSWKRALELRKVKSYWIMYIQQQIFRAPQVHGYSAKVSVTFLIRDAADFALAWLVSDQLRLGLSWPRPQYIVADSQSVETFHWALLSG